MTADRNGAPRGDPCRITVTTPLAAASYVETALEAFCQATLREPTPDDQHTARITAFARHRPDDAELVSALAAAAALVGLPPPVPQIGPEPVCDWLALNRETFRPFRVGRFYITQMWDAALPPAAAIPLRIDPGLAFGSGRHASTAGCLRAICDPILATFLSPRGWKPPTLLPNFLKRFGTGTNTHCAVLDLGCGSGILAIAAAKLWHRPVLASDVDRIAVAVAAENARRNGVGSLVQVVAADATRHRRIRRGLPFRLIFANILARPLRRMAIAVASISGAGTVLVLAGFVEDDAPLVAAVYASLGFRRLTKFTIDRWTTLVLVRGLTQGV